MLGEYMNKELSIQKVATVQEIVTNWQKQVSLDKKIKPSDQLLYQQISKYLLDLIKWLSNKPNSVINKQLLDAAIESVVLPPCDKKSTPQESFKFNLTLIKGNFIVKAAKPIDRFNGPYLLNEAQVLQSLSSHPHIVQLVASRIDPNGGIELVFPYYPLGDLFQLSTGKTGLSDEQISGFATGIASAIDFVHEQGVVHRDIKPENVFVGSDQKPRLGDFEFAVKYGKDEPPKHPLVGTIIYTPPEYVTTEIYPEEVLVNPAADVWSFGLLILVMIDKGSYLALVQDKALDKMPRYHDMYKAFKTRCFTEDIQVHIETMVKRKIDPSKASIIQDVFDGALRINPEERMSIRDICHLFEKIKI